MKINLPDWLKKILEDSGLEQGKYSFGEERVELEKLPHEFVGIAESEDGGLAVAKKHDGVIYRLENGAADVYATNKQEFLLAVRRDNAWEELSENMPATETFGLGVLLSSKDSAERKLVLGLKGSNRDSAMIIQGEVKSGEMLTDALDRELKLGLGVETFEVLDVRDEGGELEKEMGVMPLFIAEVSVEGFDPDSLGDNRIGWIEAGEERVVN